MEQLTTVGPCERRSSGLCTVLVLCGSRLFVPTFLLRLTAHDQPGHMDFNLHLPKHRFSILP